MANEVNDLVEAGKAAAIKLVEEQLLAPVIGNGTVESGLVKFFVGGVVGDMAPSGWKRAVKTAFIMDAAEDIVTDLMGKLRIPMLGGAAKAEARWL